MALYRNIDFEDFFAFQQRNWVLTPGQVGCFSNCLETRSVVYGNVHYNIEPLGDIRKE